MASTLMQHRRQTETLETKRFILRCDNLLRLAWETRHWTEQPEFFTYLGTRTEGWTFRRWHRDLRSRARRNGVIRSIVDKATGRRIGIHIVNRHPDPEIAATTILIADMSWRGKGVHTEVSTTIIDHSFRHLGVVKFASAVAEGNPAPVKHTLALGYRLEGTLREEFRLHDGTRQARLMFGLTRTDWESPELASKRATNDSATVRD